MTNLNESAYKRLKQRTCQMFNGEAGEKLLKFCCRNFAKINAKIVKMLSTLQILAKATILQHFANTFVSNILQLTNHGSTGIRRPYQTKPSAFLCILV